MPWLVRTIVDLFNAVVSWFYRRKFGEAARRMGRLPDEQGDRRGFIVLQVDGLAHQYLRLALKQGYLPYLARLLLRRRLCLARWTCGLPSTTPASQAGILFGNNWDIPGFRWYDKETGSLEQCKLPGVLRAVQDRVSAGRQGLLRGGSSYANMFDGGARLALFTLSALGRDHLFENVRGLGFVILFALNPFRVARILVLAAWTGLLYAARRIVAVIAPGRPLFTWWGPINEILLGVVMREVTTFGVMVDVYRGMPSIYASYTGYDEVAHHFGADSREAFLALRGLDAQLRQIDRIRQAYRRRPYDLYILSDHGMSPSIPFRHAYGQTLERFIAAHTGREVLGEQDEEGSERLTEARARFLLEELRAMEVRPHHAPTALLLRLARRRLEERLAARTTSAKWDLNRRGEIVVRSSGSLSHVYVNAAQRRLDLSEVTLLYPRLMEALADHEGIGLVVGREGQEVVLSGPAGSVWVGPGRRVIGTHPLAGLPDPDWVEAQVVRLASFPHSGDVILFGAWSGQQVVSFERQIASHGGLGGPQTQPFLAYSARDRSLAREVQGAEALYTRFLETYGSQG